MRYYRCKCGKMESYGSMGPARCKGCDKCGTTLATHVSLHRKPEPHDWVVKYDEDTGKPYEICRVCWEKKKDIKAG